MPDQIPAWENNSTILETKKNETPTIFWNEPNGWWVAVSAYHIRWNLRNAGWVWLPEKKWWVTRDDNLVADSYCRKFLLERDLPVLEKRMAQRQHNFELSYALEGSETFDGLYDFQNVTPVESRNRNLLIADEMGLGKTIQAIESINQNHPDNCLIVVPNVMVFKWYDALAEWLKVDTKVYIIPWSRLVKLDLNVFWDMVIVDEAHYAKNPDSKRSQAFSKLKARRKICLTGTPILGKPIEVYPIVDWLEPLILGTKGDFEREYTERKLKTVYARYGNRRQVWEDLGGKNIKKLQRILRETVMIAREKKDVLKQLPPKTRSVIQLDTDANVLGLERQISKLFHLLQENEGDMELRANIFRLRRECAMLKVPKIADFIQEIWMESQRPIIVWCHHHEVIDAIYEKFNYVKTQKLDGRMNPNDRSRVIANFQDGKVDILLCGLSAVGVGVDLTYGDTAIFAELDWTPANLVQAEDRLHRIGQEHNVSIYYCVSEDSIDGRIARILATKQDVIDEFSNVEAIK